MSLPFSGKANAPGGWSARPAFLDNPRPSEKNLRIVRFKPQQVIPWLLVALTLALYWPVRHHGFVALDDQDYVTANRQVQAGLTWEGVRWAFTTTAASNWHPLTWISHMLDVQLFGASPGSQHLVNAAAPRFQRRAPVRGPARHDRRRRGAAPWSRPSSRCTRSTWNRWPGSPSARTCSAPLFGLLALRAYLRYAARPGPGRYLAVAALFALSLLAKPMLVTLPFVLPAAGLLAARATGGTGAPAAGRASWPRRSPCSRRPLPRAWSRTRCRTRDGRSCPRRSTPFSCGSATRWCRTWAISGKCSGRRASPSSTRGCDEELPR